jgi:hypothetical protein
VKKPGMPQLKTARSPHHSCASPKPSAEFMLDMGSGNHKPPFTQAPQS